jgi:hypothetical protein
VEVDKNANNGAKEWIDKLDGFCWDLSWHSGWYISWNIGWYIGRYQSW